jgi:hypothetical protein
MPVLFEGNLSERIGMLLYNLVKVFEELDFILNLSLIFNDFFLSLLEKFLRYGKKLLEKLLFAI